MKTKITLLALFFSTFVFSQNYKLKGWVKDGGGNPIIGAKVMSEYETTYTDFTGEFEFYVSNCWSRIFITAPEFKYSVKFYDFNNQKTLSIGNVYLNRLKR